MKLGRLCLNCPETTDPVEFLKWFLSVADLKTFLANRVPKVSPEVSLSNACALRIFRIDHAFKEPFATSKHNNLAKNVNAAYHKIGNYDLMQKYLLVQAFHCYDDTEQLGVLFW